MFYNYYRQSGDAEYNECTARGACSIAPNISSLQEVLLIFLKQLAFYAIKLNEFGQDTSNIENSIIEGLSTLVSTTDYSDKLLLNIVSRLYNTLNSAKTLYQKVCDEKKINCEDLKFELKIDTGTSLSDIITQGEKAFLAKYKKISTNLKNLSEILLFVLKSICMNILQLQDFGVDTKDAVAEVLNGLNILNYSKIQISKIKEKINRLVEVDNRLLGEINTAQKNVYGALKHADVSHSTSPGKAILVSGGSLDNLYDLLETVKDEDIDVYTHGDLLIAHAFSGFPKFDRLKGHYGDCMENCILDFATFPGAIFLTKNFSQNLEFLYRGRLFTTAKIQPQGVVKIDNDNYTPLIESALTAKGFAKGRAKDSEFVGYDSEKLDEIIDEISSKFENKEIQYLFIVGVSTFSYNNQEYFKKLFKSLPKNSFVISFSYAEEQPNFLHLNLVNNLPLIYGVAEQLFKKIPVNSDRIAFFLTRCDVSSISNMLGLKLNGAKNIFLSKCPPNAMNPSVLKTLEEDYNIHLTSTPKDDIERIVNK